MKILNFTLILFLLSCNGSENKSISSNYKTENIMKTNFITFNDWHRSVMESVKAQILMENYQKDNLLKITKSISRKEFMLLQEHSEGLKISKNFKEIFIIHSSEGEVVTIKLHYLFSDGINTKKVSLKINSFEANLEKLTPISAAVFKKIYINSINSENQYQDIVVFTKVKGEKIVSEVGNPNETLMKILD